ncbi:MULTISPECIES: type VII secretion target [unclassified Nocardia]|uniref:type VII secretion target n=1 Tax=unclassified Nocardia TaxID=2637762 RepID=UPI00278C6B82|nr:MULTISPECIES: type VII secretion target [unclassified Nocardia]
MPDRMDIDPEVLRQLANQHDRVARDTREWAQPPSAWLDNFLPTYGKIAFPVYKALVQYYNARQLAGERLADQHDQTAASLRAAANSYERTDDDIASGFRRAGDEFGAPSQLPGTPGAGQPTPINGAPSADAPAVTTPAAANTDPGLNGAPIGTGLGAGAATTPAAEPTAPAATATSPAAAAPSAAGSPTAPGDTTQSTTPATTGTGAQPSGTTPGASTPPGGVVPPAVMTPAAGIPGGADQTASGTPGGSTANGVGLPMMPIAPFASALANARDKAAGPAFVVGGQPDDDLVLARTLLGGILSAVRTSALGLQWAVSVLRGPGGAMVLVTSNEGRGWLPAGVYVPQGTTLPWAVAGAETAWEGISDPARVLAEFSLTIGAASGARLTALVSSAEIDSGLRERFGDVSMQSAVPPSDEVDLSVHTPDTVDRLALTGMPRLQDKVGGVPDDKLRDHCLGLAIDAHSRVGQTSAPTPEAAAVRRLRTKILDQLREGAEVPREWWDELRDADDLLAAAMLSRRVDVRRVELGELRVDDQAALLRGLVYERRCDEVLMLLSENVTRQELRDAVYAHVQIIGHPLYTATPETVAAPDAVVAQRYEVLVSEADLVGGETGQPGVSAGSPDATATPATRVGSPTEVAPPAGTTPLAGAAPPAATVPPTASAPPAGAVPPVPPAGAVAPDPRRDDHSAGKNGAR